jgi:hypothetical protein
MDWLQLFLGQIPEAIFCALFLIYAKGIKEKRIVFTIFMIAEYLLLKYSFIFSSWFHLLYIALSFLTLKVIYKEKSQITDTFLMLIAYLIVIIVSIPSVLLFNNILISNTIAKILLFSIIFIFRDKLKVFQNLYKKLWNRPKKNSKMKSATFRSLNIVIFNLTFVVINICMSIAIVFNNK